MSVYPESFPNSISRFAAPAIAGIAIVGMLALGGQAAGTARVSTPSMTGLQATSAAAEDLYMTRRGSRSLAVQPEPVTPELDSSETGMVLTATGPDGELVTRRGRRDQVELWASVPAEGFDSAIGLRGQVRAGN